MSDDVLSGMSIDLLMKILPIGQEVAGVVHPAAARGRGRRAVRRRYPAGAYWSAAGDAAEGPPPPASVAEQYLPPGYVLTPFGVYFLYSAKDGEIGTLAVCSRPVTVVAYAPSGDVEILWRDADDWRQEVAPVTALIRRAWLLSRRLLPGSGASWNDLTRYLMASIDVAPRRAVAADETARVALEVLRRVIPANQDLPAPVPARAALDVLAKVAPRISARAVRDCLVRSGYIAPTSRTIHVHTPTGERVSVTAWMVLRRPEA